jgi:hypothetical protein
MLYLRGAVIIGAANHFAGPETNGPAKDPPSADRPEQSADLSALVGDAHRHEGFPLIGGNEN